MGKVGGEKNFGFGKQMAWAGKNALADRYGDGHYGTQAAHGERWQQFCEHAREQGVRDVQNLLSSVNVVLEVMRGDSLLKVSPSELVGERNSVRQESPAGLQREWLQQAVSDLRDKDEARVAAVAELARELGLRFREASLLDARTTLKQANSSKGAVNITEGTKGGRGHVVDRWVQVLPLSTPVLQRAAELQGNGRNLIPKGSSYVQWRDHTYHVWSKVAKEFELKGFHDLRAAYVCERYEQLTGQPAPVVADERIADKREDLEAREVISAELGHGRVDVVSAYVGSAR